MIKVGVIVNTHGLQGTVKVKSFTDFQDVRYQKGNTLYIDFKDNHIPVTVEKYRNVKGLDYLDFREFTNINEVEKFKQSNLYIKEDQQHELEDDEFYVTDLIGMDVYTSEHQGVVSDVLDLPQGQMLVVKREGKKQAMVPFLKHFVTEVNKKENKIIVIEMEGLL